MAKTKKLTFARTTDHKEVERLKAASVVWKPSHGSVLSLTVGGVGTTVELAKKDALYNLRAHLVRRLNDAKEGLAEVEQEMRKLSPRPAKARRTTVYLPESAAKALKTRQRKAKGASASSVINDLLTQSKKGR